jgi:DNA topoisomerase IB
MRLRRSRPYDGGVERVRRGRGFGYRAAQSEPVDDATLERIRGLVIPPAWRKVWICPHENGHIQAVGVDAAVRRQYLYHETVAAALRRANRADSADAQRAIIDSAVIRSVGCGETSRSISARRARAGRSRA